MLLERISHILASAGKAHTVVAADKIKVSTKIDIPKNALSIIVDYYEGSQLRGRWLLDDPTRLKLCNAISRQLGRGFISQRRGYTTVLRIMLPSPNPAPGKAVNLMSMRNDEKRLTIKFIDKKTKKPIYELSDITGEVEIVEV
jgi:hypothetical protein